MGVGRHVKHHFPTICLEHISMEKEIFFHLDFQTRFKNGKPLKEGIRHKMSKGADGMCKLTIPRAQMEDCGDYECQANNVNGSASCAAKLNILSEYHNESGSQIYLAQKLAKHALSNPLSKTYCNVLGRTQDLASIKTC